MEGCMVGWIKICGDGWINGWGRGWVNVYMDRKIRGRKDESMGA